MSVTNKFLYLDPADEPAAEKAVESEPCCCEASLTDLIAAIRECGQNPVTQLSGYLITEDPTYLPEGVSYAILFMNILTPYISKWTQHKVFGKGGGK